MSDMGVISTRLHSASKLYRPYILAMYAIRSRGGRTGQQGEVKSLLDVLVPLDRHLRGEFYYSLGINDRGMTEFLHLRRREGWPDTRDTILLLTARLERAGGAVAFSDRDLSILDDVGDALDSECMSLYSEMREHRAANASASSRRALDAPAVRVRGRRAP